MNQSAKGSGRVSIISVGWDPGLFSINRLLSEAILPNGQSYTFWGKGVSQGHSDAIRGIKGVKDAKQYTIPIDEAVERVRDGLNPQLSTAEKHLRDCYVVAEEGADKAQIEQEIKTMPNYFADYETRVTFISAQELKRNHSAMPHGGFVIRSGKPERGQQCSYSGIRRSWTAIRNSRLCVGGLCQSGPRMSQEGQSGAKTTFDVPPAYLSPGLGPSFVKSSCKLLS